MSVKVDGYSGDSCTCGPYAPCPIHGGMGDSPTVSDIMCACGHGLRDHYGTSDGDRLPQPCSVCKCDDFVETEGDEDSPTVSEPRTPALVSALAYALARADLPTDMETSRDYATRLAPLVLESGWLAEAAQPIDVERWVKWVIEVSGVDRSEIALIYDHACRECVPDGPMVVPGFVCVPHAAARLRASDTDHE